MLAVAREYLLDPESGERRTVSYCGKLHSDLVHVEVIRTEKEQHFLCLVGKKVGPGTYMSLNGPPGELTSHQRKLLEGISEYVLDGLEEVFVRHLRDFLATGATVDTMIEMVHEAVVQDVIIR